MSTQTAATVIITTYDRYDLVPGAINSVLQQDMDSARFEIVVVDNCPDPEKHDQLKSTFKTSRNVRIIKEMRKGLSSARNAGIAASKAPVICFIDDDALADKNWLSEVLRAFERFGDKVGVVGGAIAPKWTGPVPDWLDNDHLGHLSIIAWGGQLRIARPEEWFAGCNIAFDRKSLLDAGGFNLSLGRFGDDTILLSNDESDVINRIEKAGKIKVYAPDACVEHIIDPSRLTVEWFRKRLAWQAVSDYLMDSDAAGKFGSIAAQRARGHVANYPHQSLLARLLERFHLASRNGNPPNEIGYVYDMVMALLAGKNIFPSEEKPGDTERPVDD